MRFAITCVSLSVVLPHGVEHLVLLTHGSRSLATPAEFRLNLFGQFVFEPANFHFSSADKAESFGDGALAQNNFAQLELVRRQIVRDWDEQR